MLNFWEGDIMIVMKKHIAAAVLIIIAVAVVFYGIKKYESSQTFADSDLKIILDAGHGDPDGGAVGSVILVQSK